MPFASITNCLETIYDNHGGKWEEYSDNPNYIIRKDSYKVYKHDDGSIYQRVFMAWNLGKIKKLAKMGNKYAQEFLSNT